MVDFHADINAKKWPFWIEPLTVKQGPYVTPEVLRLEPITKTTCSWETRQTLRHTVRQISCFVYQFSVLITEKLGRTKVVSFFLREGR